jgi:DNA-binding NarL/FixJ family response regulator
MPSAPLPDARRARILLVDDHPVVREGLSLRIAGEPDLEVSAAIGQAEGALTAIEQFRPDLVILDLALPDGHGLDLTKDIHAVHPQVRILIFSMHDEQLYCERALRAGASGYVMKHEPPDYVIKSIREVLAGEIVVSPRLTRQMLKSARCPGTSRLPSLESLTDRELEVFQLIGAGMATKEIAERLHRGVKTIETHRLRLKQKLGLKSHTELVAKAAAWSNLGERKEPPGYRVAEDSDRRRPTV